MERHVRVPFRVELIYKTLSKLQSWWCFHGSLVSGLNAAGCAVSEACGVFE